MLNPWVKRKWVRALRRGEYEKGVYRLWSEENGGYCCLGVLLCEMVPEFVRVEKGEAWIGKGKEIDDHGDGPVNNQWIPDELGLLFGIDKATQESLAAMNDGETDFRPIADWIEENL